MVHIHVGDERNADARWLEYVDDVDAHVRTAAVRCHSVLPRYVGCHDACYDAAVPGTDAAALS